MNALHILKKYAIQKCIVMTYVINTNNIWKLKI